MINVPNPKRLVRAWVILAALSVPFPAFATLRFYVGPDGGNWSTAGNWSGAAVPVNGDDVWVQPGNGDRNVIMDATYSSPGLFSFNLDGQNFSTATLTQSSGTLIVNVQEEYGVSNNGRGRYIQNGGTHTNNGQLILGLTSGSTGSYELGGGILNVNFNSSSNIAVGGQGTGIFTQTGGTSNVSQLQVGARFAGGSGNYSISNGTLNANVILVGDPGNGNFNQTGGNVNAVVLQTGIGGSYNLSEGNLTVTNFINNSNYSQSHGFFAGSITNNGSLSFNGGGMTINGAGFNNAATLNLAGGFITANATITNNGQISFYGTPSIGGTAQFNNLGVISQGSGTLTISVAASNSGNINLAAGGGIALTGANYTNNGTINLGSGRISGSAQLINRSGATITGAGLISSSFDNQGRLLLTDGTTLITNAFNNSGIIQLAGNAASLSGGLITNSGQITGHGSTGNTISNTSGTIEASGGTLILGGVVTNGAGGTISAPTDGKVFVSLGLGTSSGLINLTGGTFDNNNHALTNTGQISGYGIARTSGLTNQGNITLATGVSTVNGAVTNQSAGRIEVQFGSAVFTGAVNNQGTIKTTGATLTFAGGFTNAGAYISDPSTQSFTDLTIMPSGFLVGGAGDVFKVSHSFINQSTQNTSWNTRGASLVFNGAGAESVLLAGMDKGALYDGYTDNFAWGSVELGTGAGLSITSGTAGKGALYAGLFTLDGGLSQLASIFSDYNIYYDPQLAGNSYLGGQIYALNGAGFLIPTAVPEPETYAMLLAGFGLLGFAARRRKTLG